MVPSNFILLFSLLMIIVLVSGAPGHEDDGADHDATLHVHEHAGVRVHGHLHGHDHQHGEDHDHVHRDEIPDSPLNPTIDRLAARCEKNDRDFSSRTLLGRLYLRRAKQAKCYADYGRAEAVLRQALEVRPDKAEPARQLAAALNGQHRFEESIVVLEPLLERDPNDVAALAATGDAWLELSRHDLAEAMYERLAAIDDSGATTVRFARLAHATNDLQRAIDLAEKAATMAEDEGAPGERLAWFHWHAGRMLLEGGRIDDAECSFHRALQVMPDDVQAMTGLAAVNAARRKP